MFSALITQNLFRYFSFMKKHFLVMLCLCILQLFAAAQQALPDSLQKRIDTATTPQSKLEAYVEAGDFYYQFYNAPGFSKAADMYELAREVADKTKDSILIGMAYSSLGQVYDAVGDDKLPKALEYYSIFERTSYLMKDTPVILRSHINVAHTLMRLKQTEACKQKLALLTSLSKKYNRLKNINKSHVFAAFVAYQLNDFELCKKYFSVVDAVRDTIVNGSLGYKNMYQLTKLYLLDKENRFEEALLAGEEALASSSNKSDSMNIYSKLGDYALKARQFEKAYQYKKKELDLYGDITRETGLSSTDNSLLKSEIKLKEENAALLQSKQHTQQRINNWLTIGLVIMSLALAGIFWFAFNRRKQNKKLEAQVSENKLLLQEVHHRVKNNLQILSSFMLLQQMKKNVDSEELIKQLQSKIQALALIHQKLHQQNSYSAVELQSYFEQLVVDTLAIHSNGNVAIKYAVNADDTFLNLDTLTPLALITTELLLNTIKYVAVKQPCQITITAQKKQDTLIFTYADDGKGLPDLIQFDTVSSTGLRLVKRLAKQIKAGVTVSNNATGLSFLFEIPV
jgi:two-component system, sensor histidine kinase PdtaS